MQEEHDFVHESTSTDKAPLSAIVRSESVERLRAAINKLTDELRELTTLVLAEVSVKGIAAKLGISYYAAKRRKKAAFRRLA
jgi:DNA-directed RNA polymerase specialized sigma24 family protein